MPVGVGVVVAGWFVSAVLSKIVAVVYEGYSGNFPSWLSKEMGDELSKLKSLHPQITAVVEAAEQMQFLEGNEGLNRWLQQLKDALEDAENAFEEVEYKVKQKQLKDGENQVSNSSTTFTDGVKHALREDPFLKRVKEAVASLCSVADTMGPFLKLANTMQSQQNRTTSAFSDIKIEDFSREEDLEKAVNILTSIEYESGDDNIAVLPILGHGGMGKTTLARQAYNDERIQNYFGMKLWICVSNDFDVLRLTKRILESTYCKRSMSELNAMQTELKRRVEVHRFLLVLDDCWYDEDISPWQTLLGPLIHGKKGEQDPSYNSITDSSKNVAEIRKSAENYRSNSFEGLGEKKMELLLEKYAFVKQDHINYSKLQDIRSKIANKLHGSPLAAKVIGGVLTSKPEEDYWMHILNSDLLDRQHGKDVILSTLKLSYQYLPPHLRPCFVFCSIFPQDHWFKKKELVSMWIALGYVEKIEDINRWKVVGEQYFDDLLWRSFFDAHPDEPGVYVMHDLLHDLAKYIAGAECIHHAGNKVLQKPEVRHLFIEIENIGLLRKIPILRYLRTLILVFGEGCESEFETGLELVLQNTPYLRVLVLDIRCLNACFRRLPRELPKSTWTLHHLQLVNIKGGSLDIDCGLEKLINLRHLIGDRYKPHIIFLSSGIGRLSSLEELKIVWLQKNKGHMLRELGTMSNLVELGIQNLQYVESSSEVKSSKLADKEMLRELYLGWEESYSEDSVSELVLDGLRPNEGLKELKIRKYMGSRSPIWMQNGSYLTNLTYLALVNCEHWEELPSLPINLSELQLYNVGLITLPSEGIWQQLRGLQVLQVSDCGKLRSLGGLQALRSVPKKLRIIRCPKILDAAGILPQKAQTTLEGSEGLEINLDHPIILPPFADLSRTVLKVHVNEANEIQSLPNILWNLTALKELRLRNLNSLQSLSESFGNLAALQKLHLRDLNSLQSLPQSLGNLTALQELRLEYLNLLQSLPDSLGNLTALKKLHLIDLHSLQLLPDSLCNLTALQKLQLMDLNSLQSLPKSLGRLPSLLRLTLWNVPMLHALPDVPDSIKIGARFILHPRLREQLEERRKRLPDKTELGTDEERCRWRSFLLVVLHVRDGVILSSG